MRDTASNRTNCRIPGVGSGSLREYLAALRRYESAAIDIPLAGGGSPAGEPSAPSREFHVWGMQTSSPSQSQPGPESESVFRECADAIMEARAIAKRTAPFIRLLPDAVIALLVHRLADGAGGASELWVRTVADVDEADLICLAVAAPEKRLVAVLEPVAADYQRMLQTSFHEARRSCVRARSGSIPVRGRA